MLQSITRYLNVQGVANRAPSIAWQSAPGTVEMGQVYSVSAQGSDPDGNLTQVNVWKNGQPFAFAGGGDGTNGNSGNQTSDGSPQTVIYTAQAVDVTGAVSELISFTVIVTAPPPPLLPALLPHPMSAAPASPACRRWRRRSPTRCSISAT